MEWNRDVLSAMRDNPAQTIATYRAPTVLIVPADAMQMVKRQIKEGRDMKKTKGKGGKGKGYGK